MAVLSPTAGTTMLCAIYRSERKANTYLYVPKQDKPEENLTRLPEALLKPLGELVHVMDLDLASRSSLARADINAVIQSLKEKGAYLQLPPSNEELARLDQTLANITAKG